MERDSCQEETARADGREVERLIGFVEARTDLGGGVERHQRG